MAGLVGFGLESSGQTAAGLDSGYALIVLACYLLSYVAGGWHAFIHALGDLRRSKVNIDFLMIAAACGSASLGEWADGAALLFLFSLSHALEAYILGRTRRAISDLMNLTPDEAVRIANGGEETVPVTQLRAADIVLVRPGERIPADGLIQQGDTSIDESPVSGESIPRDKSPGDTVFAGTLNQQGAIEVRVLRPASQSTLARMVELVEQAQSERATTQQFTEWFGERYSWLVLSLALATFVGFISLGSDSWSAAFARAMTVLVAASPCAVVISIPAAILTGISSAARGGVLFKGGLAMEQAARLKGMAFDKTGTLTLGQPRVVQVLPAHGISEKQLLVAAAALESRSEHPLARAIVEAAQEAGYPILGPTGFAAVTGSGVTGQVDGTAYEAGKLAWLTSRGDVFLDSIVSGIEAAMSRGETLVGVVRAGEQRQVLGAIAIADTVRPSAAACLRKLREHGVKELIMLTGDAEPVARELGRRLQLPYQAALLPAEKLQAIKQLRERIGPVGMIGDGMNDAPSLAAADLGFSLAGAGTDVALETADVVILADDLNRLPYAIGLARVAQSIIRQNLFISFSVIALLLLTTLLTHLPLPVAVLAHEGSTVLVILNGLRLFLYRRPAAELDDPASRGG